MINANHEQLPSLSKKQRGRGSREHLNVSRETGEQRSRGICCEREWPSVSGLNTFVARYSTGGKSPGHRILGVAVRSLLATRPAGPIRPSGVRATSMRSLVTTRPAREGGRVAVHWRAAGWRRRRGRALLTGGRGSPARTVRNA